LAVADAKKIREIFIGSKATPFVVETLDFDEKSLLHEGELVGQPNLFWNPDAFKIASVYGHWSSLYRIQKNPRRRHCGQRPTRGRIQR
jgi:hypothetical protein